MVRQVRLIGLSGDYGGSTFPITEDETLIGRGEDCHLQIVDARISRHHARLRREGEAWTLEDLGSTHGTFVKGERIEKAILQHGDTITLGETVLRFEGHPEQDEIPTVMASADDIATVLDVGDGPPATIPSPDEIPTQLASVDDVPTVLDTPDAIPTQAVTHDDVATALASPDDVDTRMVSPDDQPTVMAGEQPSEEPDQPPPPTIRASEALPIAPPVPPPSSPEPAIPGEKKPFPWKWIAIGGGIIVALAIIGVGLSLMRGIVGGDAGTSAGPAPRETEALAVGTDVMQASPIIPPTLTQTVEAHETPPATNQPPHETVMPTPGIGPVSGALSAVYGDSAQIAFASDRSGRPQIYLINMDTLEERQLTDVSGGACQPAWSPDGSRLAYTSPCNTNREEYGGSSVFILEIDLTGNPGALAPLIGTVGGGDYDPVWSRDGSRIAFTSWRTGRPQIFTVKQDGSDLRNLNDDLAYNWAPTWSHDGAMLAFLTGRGGAEEIWTVPAGGGEERRFSRSDGKDVARPDWSPDGTTIVFEKIVGNIPRLIAAPVADGGVRELQVCQEGSLSLQPMGEPVWSPDGNWLAFETWPDGVNHEIAVMRSNCTEYQLLTRAESLEFDAAWRPIP